MSLSEADEIQRGRYSEIAESYDNLHDDPEHEIALRFLAAMLDFAGVSSVLDVGSGTGRAMTFLKTLKPELRIVGVEPVEALREAAYSKGISREELIDGDGYNLPFSEGEFDLVCEVGVLHHVREPSRVVGEMLRVADRAIFISDNNNFGGGSQLSRFVKQLIHSLGLWRLTQFVITGGKGYAITEGDGLFYSYSVVDSLKQIRGECAHVHMLNTGGEGPNLYRTAPHIALLGLKRGYSS
jgi:SAM-dependent methyltransferase